MLAALSIREIVLIERLSLAFRPGLSVLTGETGAGKSILLDALGLALGARADVGLIRRGAEQAQVTAEFDLPPVGQFTIEVDLLNSLNSPMHVDVDDGRVTTKWKEQPQPVGPCVKGKFGLDEGCDF